MKERTKLPRLIGVFIAAYDVQWDRLTIRQSFRD